MCKAKEHVFIWVKSPRQPEPPIGTRCVCGLHRWGTDDELRAFDEVVELERVLALPAKEPS